MGEKRKFDKKNWTKKKITKVNVWICWKSHVFLERWKKDRNTNRNENKN